MTWKGWFVTLIVAVLLFYLMSLGGFFMHGDPVE